MNPAIIKILTSVLLFLVVSVQVLAMVITGIGCFFVISLQIIRDHLSDKIEKITGRE